MIFWRSTQTTDRIQNPINFDRTIIISGGTAEPTNQAISHHKDLVVQLEAVDFVVDVHDSIKTIVTEILITITIVAETDYLVALVINDRTIIDVVAVVVNSNRDLSKKSTSNRPVIQKYVRSAQSVFREY